MTPRLIQIFEDSQPKLFVRELARVRPRGRDVARTFEALRGRDAGRPALAAREPRLAWLADLAGFDLDGDEGREA